MCQSCGKVFFKAGMRGEVKILSITYVIVGEDFNQAVLLEFGLIGIATAFIKMRIKQGSDF